MKNIINTLNRNVIKILPPKKVLWIVFVGLVLRLVVFIMIEPWTKAGEHNLLNSEHDGHNYNLLAIELKDKGTFAASNPYLSAVRTPGYPFFLAVCYTFFGERSWIILVIQIVMDCILITVIYFLAEKMFDPLTAFIAALCYSLEPLAIEYVNTLLSDMIFVFFLVISWFFLWNFIKDLKNKWLIFNVITLAVAAYIRPVALYFFVAELLFLGGYFYFKKKYVLKTLILAAFFYYLLISPWMIRNVIVHNHWFFSTSSEYNSLILYASDVEADARGVSSIQVKKKYQNYFAERYSEITNANIFELHARYEEKAHEILKKYPVVFALSYIKGLADMFFSSNRKLFETIIDEKDKVPFDAFELLRDEGIFAFKKYYNDYPRITLYYIFIMCGWYFLCYFFALIGIVQIFKHKEWATLFFILLPILYFIFITGQAGSARFKLPVIPFYLLFMAYGIKYLVINKKIRLFNRHKSAAYLN